MHAIPTYFWLLFSVIAFVMVFLDLFALSKFQNDNAVRVAVGITVSWLIIAASFAAILHVYYGADYSLPFTVAYFVELSLSLDNIFVFLLIFQYFHIDLRQQHRLLFIGVISAIVMRFVIIYFGIKIISEAKWLFYIFGVILIYSGIKVLKSSKNSADHSNPDSITNKITKFFRITNIEAGNSFTTRIKGKFFFTRLTLVLLLIEKADLIFAVDSIPAVLLITDIPFIAFTSNIFAILGLRSMYFMLANVIEKFIYLKYGIAVILTYIGIKMLLSATGYHIPALISLLFIITSLLIATLISVRKANPADKS